MANWKTINGAHVNLDDPNNQIERSEKEPKKKENKLDTKKVKQEDDKILKEVLGDKKDFTEYYDAKEKYVDEDGYEYYLIDNDLEKAYKKYGANEDKILDYLRSTGKDYGMSNGDLQGVVEAFVMEKPLQNIGLDKMMQGKFGNLFNWLYDSNFESVEDALGYMNKLKLNPKDEEEALDQIGMTFGYDIDELKNINKKKIINDYRKKNKLPEMSDKEVNELLKMMEILK